MPFSKPPQTRSANDPRLDYWLWDSDKQRAVQSTKNGFGGSIRLIEQ